ncbi:MAG: nucleotidyltransferase domain-containing protein [Nitrospira sp.]|nr:nucleotidyltransferase domain-containing protein [Nitrospira sp.]
MLIFAYNYTMNLYILKYLFLLIFEGEKNIKELSIEAGGTIYNASRAMSILHGLGLVKHPVNRSRSWQSDITKKMNIIAEKLLLASKYDKKIMRLFEKKSIVKIGARLCKNNKGLTVAALISSTGLSKITVETSLRNLNENNLVTKKPGKPNIYYCSDMPVSNLFFETCTKIDSLFAKNSRKMISPGQIIKELRKDDSVLILIHYGSSARGHGDKFSDIDVLVVTRDRISRGEILSRYGNKIIDLSVYSKNGFLQMLKTHPDFISHISKATVLKGKDIFEAVTR